MDLVTNEQEPIMQYQESSDKWMAGGDNDCLRIPEVNPHHRFDPLHLQQNGEGVLPPCGRSSVDLDIDTIYALHKEMKTP